MGRSRLTSHGADFQMQWFLAEVSGFSRGDTRGPGGGTLGDFRGVCPDSAKTCKNLLPQVLGPWPARIYSARIALGCRGIVRDPSIR